MTLRDHAIDSYLDQAQLESCYLAVYSDSVNVITKVSADYIAGVDQFGHRWFYDRRKSGRWDCSALTLIPLASIEEAYRLYPEYWL